MSYDFFIGIDYSGAGTPETRLNGLQVYKATLGLEPIIEQTHPGLNWNRLEIAHWIIDLIRKGKHVIIGIDHGFSFPESFMDHNGIKTWPKFIAEFCKHWPTNIPEATVSAIRENNRWTGNVDEFRLCERWTSSAKSVFNFGPNGVAYSTHAGIPWLQFIRKAVGSQVHMWPFDGWQVPEEKSLIVEVYPAIFKKRYQMDNRTPDQQDAYSVARWLKEIYKRKEFERYLNPPLTDSERERAGLEGWIFGIT